MKMVYNIDTTPRQIGIGKTIICAIQQLLAIMAATLVVPVSVSTNAGLTGADAMGIAPALFGAGCGTLTYILFTRRKSPVFLGSSFAFIPSMVAAFAGATTVAVGYIGLILGAIFAGLVYVVLSIIVKRSGTGWIDKIMPATVIGPTVATIGLQLSGGAVGSLTTGPNVYIAILCGLVALFVAMLCTTYGKKNAKLIPFVIGILAGYAVALVFTIIGYIADIDSIKMIDFSVITALWDGGISSSTFISDTAGLFVFVRALGGFADFNIGYIGTIIMAYVPVGFVVFAEHLADHKNLSSIIEKDLLTDPGLHNTLLGDGIGSMVGAFFGGCPNTTYGESIATVALTRNAAVWTIVFASLGAIILSFFAPFVAFFNSIPTCVMGGICIALYGFIAVSGLKMIQKVDLDSNRNIFVISVILVCGIGGLSISFAIGANIAITITNVACALILGVITNKILAGEKAPSEEDNQ